MDFEKFSWKLFEKTGDINIYLALKDDCEIPENMSNFSDGNPPAQKEDVPAGV